VAEFVETIIVGGGQAGLAISYYLKQEGRNHVVLERELSVANAWRNQRWDSFTLVTPNFQVRMPGAEYNGPDPYGFLSLAQVIKYFDDYVERFGLPVHCGVEVFSIEKTRLRGCLTIQQYPADLDKIHLYRGDWQLSFLLLSLETDAQNFRSFHPLL
jgi:putative flavoprotein involved in K+ transport